MDDGFWDGTAGTNAIDLPAFFDSGVIEKLGEVLALGVLVSIGLTRDGGAVGLAVFDDGRRRREYFRDSTAASDFLGAAAASLSGNGIGAPARKPPVSRKPSRGA